MQGQFHTDSGSDAQSHEGCRTIPTPHPTPSQADWPLAREIQQLLGEDSDLDPLFFEETWSLGIPAAVENRRLRHVLQDEHKVRRNTFQELDSLGVLSFTHTRGRPADFVRRGHAATIARGYAAGWVQDSPDETTSRTQDQPPPGFETPTDNPNRSQPILPPATHAAARQLLGVAINSSAEQIKAAYRQRVRQWHPDRLHHRGEEVCRCANQHLAAINRAYGILRGELPL